MRTQAALASLAAALLASSVCGCSNENPRAATKMNLDAAFKGSLPWNPLQGRVITTWIDPRRSTMSTLYGDDAAVGYARTNVQHVYPAGSILAAVTWSQREDERWFGAKIPVSPQSVEFVIVQKTSESGIEYLYEKYEGNPLRRATIAEGPSPNERATYLLSQRAAVMP